MDRLFIIILLSLVMKFILTVNSQGLRSPDRRKMAFSYFLRNRLDIILLQETHWTIDMEMEIKREWIGDVFFNHGTNNARGVAILIHSRLECTVSQIRSDNEVSGHFAPWSFRPQSLRPNQMSFSPMIEVTSPHTEVTSLHVRR